MSIDETVEEEPIVTLTPAAAKEFKDACDAEKKAYELRLGVRGGGCAGMEYFLDFNEKTNEYDNVFEQYGIKIYIDPLSTNHLEGSTLDYVNGLLESGFKFNNPHATRSCGCGSSFS